MSKVIQSTEVVDYVTGEVKETTVVKQFRGDEPNYVKLYLKDISYLYDLPATAGNLLYELLNYVTYGTQMIVLNSTVKKMIAASTGIAMQTLNNRLQDLVNKGVLDRVDTGTFTLNPYLFGKGDWKTIRDLRNQNIHLEIEYDSVLNTRIIRGKTKGK